MRLDKNVIVGLVRPADKDDVVVWDDSLPCFGVRLRGKRKTYLVQYRINGQQRRESLGDVRKIQLDDARSIARRRFAEVELGTDPAVKRAAARAAADAAALTLASVAERYLEAKQDRLRPNTYIQAKHHFTALWTPLAKRPIDSIRRAEIAAHLQVLIKERGPVAAARARGNLSALFTWAMREGLCESNPTIATNDPAEGIQPRDRVLSEAELASVWRACGDDDFGCIVRLLILTGCRRQEIGDLKRQEIDFDRGVITIPGTRTKNRRALALTLPTIAIDLLQSVPRRDDRNNVFGGGFDGFNAWSYSTIALNNRIAVAEGQPLAPWTLHDLRRSMATHAAELGVQPHIVEAILNHVSGHKRGVAGIYNRARYDREIASALALWAEHVSAVVEGRDRKVVPLRTA
jgi:integrase